MEHQVVIDTRAESDARLAFGVAMGTLAAYAVFAVWPVSVSDPRWLFGLDAVWGIAGYLTVLLGPLVAGMAAYLSFLALWVKGAELSTGARRMHLITLLVVACLFVALVSPWGADLMSAWFGD